MTDIMDDAVDEEDDEADVVWVQEENILSFEMFRECHWDRQVDQGVMYRLGISASEILSQCELMQIPVQDRPMIHGKIKYMASIAGPIINQETVRLAKQAMKKR